MSSKFSTGRPMPRELLRVPCHALDWRCVMVAPMRRLVLPLPLPKGLEGIAGIVVLNKRSVLGTQRKVFRSLRPSTGAHSLSNLRTADMVAKRVQEA